MVVRVKKLPQNTYHQWNLWFPDVKLSILLVITSHWSSIMYIAGLFFYFIFQETVACQDKNFFSDFMLEIKSRQWPSHSQVESKLLTQPESHQPASPSPDPQWINSPASHANTCPSWPAAMATHVNFFRQHATRFSASILPFILCESITATKQDTVVHWHAQIIPTPPPPDTLSHTHRNIHTHLNRQIQTTVCTVVYVRFPDMYKLIRHINAYVTCIHILLGSFSNKLFLEKWCLIIWTFLKMR